MEKKIREMVREAKKRDGKKVDLVANAAKALSTHLQRSPLMSLQSRSHLRVRQNRGTPQRKWKKTTRAPGQLKSTGTFQNLTPTGLVR